MSRTTPMRHATRHSQAGIGLGYLLLIIVLLVAIGAAAMKMGSDSPPGPSAQQAQLAAGTLANQIGDQRGNLALLSTSTTSDWHFFGPTSTTPTHMSLGFFNGVSTSELAGIDTSRQVSIGPRGNSGPLTWTYTTPTSATAPIFMYTPLDVPLAVCSQFNVQARGLALASATVVDAVLGDAITPSSQSAIVVTATLPPATITAALNAGDGCFTVAAGTAGRIVARVR